jgi:hypothetical protein
VLDLTGAQVAAVRRGSWRVRHDRERRAEQGVLCACGYVSRVERPPRVEGAICGGNFIRLAVSGNAGNSRGGAALIRGRLRRERGDTGSMTETESLIAEVRQLRADVAGCTPRTRRCTSGTAG